MVKYTPMYELMKQVHENERSMKEKLDLSKKDEYSEGTVSEEEDPKADNAKLQLDKRIAQVKAQIAALQQNLDNLQDRK